MLSQFNIINILILSTNMSNLDLIRLRDNVERRRQVDSEIRIVKKSFRRRYS